jgi:hypothetical protein
MGLEDRLRRLEKLFRDSSSDESEHCYNITIEEAREGVHALLLPKEKREAFWSLTPEEREREISEYSRWLHETQEGKAHLRGVRDVLKTGR